MTAPPPSSLTSGFFQPHPTVLPAYSSSAGSCAALVSDDPIISRLISLYLPTPAPSHVTTHLHMLSRQVISPFVLQHTVDADTNLPTLHPLTTFGEANSVTPLRTSPAWKALKRFQTENGVIGHGYPQQPASNIDPKYNLRIHQFLTLHIWGPSSAVTTCPVAMTDGAAVLLRSVLASPSPPASLTIPAKAVFEDAYSRLTSLNPDYAWTSGQWMTERSGGSSVAGTETLARRLTEAEIAMDNEIRVNVDATGMPLGDWRINGFKWFSSATDADCAVLLAQTPKGLSAFYAPMRRSAPAVQGGSIMNGVTISRLKNKLGTKALPTAELEIKGMRGWLLGEEGQGVKMISKVLNITRLWTANGGVSGWGRGLAISRAFTSVRQVKGGVSLADVPQHMKWMADETVIYKGMTHLYMLGVALLGLSEGVGTERTEAHEMELLPDTKIEAEALLRLLTPVIKYACSLRSVEGLRACMESLGGVGYCENNEDDGVLNIARLYRDANVNPIWEGTGSVMAEDLLRALQVKRKGAVELEIIFGKWIYKVLAKVRQQGPRFQKEIRAVEARYITLKRMVQGKSEEELLRQGRVVVEHFEALVCAVLLMVDSCVHGNEVSAEVARRWVKMKLSMNEEVVVDWKRAVDMDRSIFLGEAGPRLREVAKL